MFKSKSIKFKLASWGIGSIFIVSVFLIYTSSSRLYTSLYNNVKESSKGQAERSANEITTTLNNAFSTARNLGHAFKAAKASSGQLSFTRKQANELLKNTLREDSSLLGVWTLWEPDAFDSKDMNYAGKGHSDSTGRYIPYWTMGDNGEPQVEALVDYEVPGSGDYYLLARKLKKEVILEPYIYKVNGVDTLITTLTVPIIVDGKFLGVTGVDISLDFFQKLVTKINIYDGAGKIFIFSNSGIVAAFSKDKGLINKKITKLKIKDYENIKTSRFSNSSSVLIDNHNVSTLVPLLIGKATTPWYIETLVPTSIIKEDIRNSILELIGWGIIITGLLIFSGIYTINKISKNLADIAGQLQIEADHVREAADEIDKSSSRLSSATHQQSANLQETSTSIDEISAMVEKSSDTATSTTTLSKESQRKAEEGKHSVNNVKNKIDEININNSNLVKSVEKNNEDVENIINIITEIEDKTKVINDIVFQTKLLSFNASVEAARAGEHGKGFSVVAEEVGALAQMSGTAAKEISELLEASSNQVRKTVQSSKDSINTIIKEGNLKVEEGLKEIETCDKRLFEIVDSFQQVNHAVEDISASSSEQSSGVNEITRAINQLNQVTHENTSIANESSQKALELKSQSEDLAKIVDQIQSVVFGDEDKKAA